jgi:hypothetical protein
VKLQIFSDLHCDVAPTNPHGYGAENPAFDPMFIVEVGTC